MRIGLVGVDGSHAEDFLRHFNTEARHHDITVTAFWGGSRERANELLALSPGLVAADSLDKLIASVDAVIVGDRHGDLHVAHALPAIAGGRPVFVDKPLACGLDDATAIVNAAERAGMPLLSASALRWQRETVILKARLAYLDGPFTISAYGTWYPDNEYGGAIYYAIHTVELMQELLGTSWHGLRVERGSDGPVIRYSCGRADVAISLRPLGADGSSAFGVSVTSPQLTCNQPIPLPDDYMAPVTDHIARMLQTGKSEMERETLLAPIRLMAGIDALLAGG
jgi:predicted dehydrogenase